MKKFFTLLSMMLIAITGMVNAQIAEGLNGGDIMTVSTAPVKESFKANTWYVMYNQGRKGYANGALKLVASGPVNGSTVASNCAYLVKFVESTTEGKYYILNGEGKYYKDLSYNGNNGVSATTTGAGSFTVGEISAGYYYFQGATYVMDSNGSSIVGWATSAPTSTSGNSSWVLHEVEMTDPSELSGGALVSYQLANGGLFRIKSRNATQYILENQTTHKATTGTKSTAASSNMNQMWIVERGETGFSLRNAKSGNYLQDDYTCNTTKYFWTVQLSPNNTSTNDPYIILCHGTVKAGERNCANLNGGSSGLTNWFYDNDKNSEWVIETVKSSEVDTAKVKANIDAITGAGVINLEEGQYYQFYNLDDGNVLTERISDNIAITLARDEKSYNQYWRVISNDNGNYVIQNVYSRRYLIHKATSVSSACGGNYQTNSLSSTSNSRPWILAVGSYAWQTTFNFIEPSKPTTGIGLKAGVTVNSPIDATNAQWVVKRVELTDEEVAAAEELYGENEILLKTSTTTLTNTLYKFFADYACTELRDNYKDMNDDEFAAELTDAGLPVSMVRMALKTKNETWSHREKEFRIYDYEPYSDYRTWAGGKYMGTGYVFSPQTGPTGISVKPGDIVVFYVEKNPVTNTTLTFSSNKGYDICPSETALKRGVNVYVANEPGFLFIHHTVTNATKTLDSFSPVKVHIEGGRVQGYFDITRGHTNEDWKDMVNTLFQDEIVHLKSKYYEYNMDYAGVKKEITAGELDEVDTDGCPKGIEGTLRRWDDLVANQRIVMGAEQFLDRFNCMLSASSSSTGNPYASSYGTYYPGVGTIMNYKALTRGTKGDNGGNFWCIAHETGHVHQGLYNMAGCTEISNNNFSQINTWLQGSNTGRGGAWSEAQASFHEGVFWNEYDLWQRSRAYFQLWLYFHLQEHDMTFYPRMFDKFRETPMSRSGNSAQPGSGTTDYLRFAKYACEVAQADLSEFFQFWGFFVPLDNYEVGDYSNSYFTTTQAEIDEAVAYMKSFPKKLGNILFIDERIKEYPADYPGMPDGAKRVATTPNVNPGDAAVVGQLGMFTDFVDDVDYMPYSCSVSPTTGKTIISQSSGKGAVGFKVYNADHVMIACYNTYNFTLPATIRSTPFYIKAALGDGTDRLIYDPKDISPVEDATTAEESDVDANAPIYNLEGQIVSAPKAGGIYIQNGRKFRMK